MKKISIAVVLVLLLIGAAVFLVVRKRETPRAEKPVATTPVKARDAAIAIAPTPAPVVDPLPGQGKAVIDSTSGAGSVAGRVINWSTGDGVEGADVTFTSNGAATTVRSRAQGTFELAPPEPGHFVLTAVSAQGFLPYAPELLHSSVHVEVVKERSVGGITVFLFPAIDYEGRVVDAKGAGVAGAKVRLVGTPDNEQAIEKLETEWTTDKDGKFAFHAADGAVFEAVKGNLRGWSIVNGDVNLTRLMTIAIAAAPARDAKITGHVIDPDGKPLANVLVRAAPDDPPSKEPRVRAVSFATTDDKGAFVLDDLDRDAYDVRAKLDGFAATTAEHVAGGTKNLAITLQLGETLTGTVVDGRGSPVGAYTLLVTRRQGTAFELITARSIVDATGRFEVRVVPGEYDVQAHATGWAPSEPVVTKTNAPPVKLTVSEGATLSGRVVDEASGDPISYARIMREGRGGGASAQPANAGTVTRADGTFELTGIPTGPFSITIGAGQHHPRIEGGLIAADGDKLGPLTIKLVKLKEGETPKLELVGIGVKIAGQKDDFLLVDGVIAGGGAEAAGIVQGDQIIAVDGIPVTKIGLDGAISRIRGAEGTTISITLRRDGKPVVIVATRKKLRA